MSDALIGQCPFCGGNLTADHDCGLLKPQRACGKYERPKGIMGGPCLNCGRPQPEHVHREPVPPKRKANHIGAPACFALEQACQQVRAAFGHYGIYQVGSSLDRADWRDVDLRYILPDAEFQALFPDAQIFEGGTGGTWEQDPRWLLLTVAISQWLSKASGLPVDFQFQPQTHANERHKGPRNAFGIRIAKAVPQGCAPSE